MYSYKLQLLDTDTVMNAKTYTRSERFLLFPSMCLGREEALGGETVRFFFSKATRFSASVYEAGPPWIVSLTYTIFPWSLVNRVLLLESTISKRPSGKPPEQAEDSSRFFERRRYYAQKQDFCPPIWKRCGHPPNKFFFLNSGREMELIIELAPEISGFWPLVGEIWFILTSQTPTQKRTKGPAVDVGPVMWEWIKTYQALVRLLSPRTAWSAA